MDKIVNMLNNKYILALMVALFLWGLVRSLKR